MRTLIGVETNTVDNRSQTITVGWCNQWDGAMSRVRLTDDVCGEGEDDLCVCARMMQR